MGVFAGVVVVSETHRGGRKGWSRSVVTCRNTIIPFRERTMIDQRTVDDTERDEAFERGRCACVSSSVLRDKDWLL